MSLIKIVDILRFSANIIKETLIALIRRLVYTYTHRLLINLR